MKQTHTPTNRILAIDLARGASVFFVVIIHTLWMYGTVDTQSNTWLGHIVHFMGKGTPMFLLAMGFSFCLSRKQDTKAIIKRGLELLAIGYGMNLFKFIVPYFLGLMPNNFVGAYGWEAPLTGAQLLYLFQTGDILQLAGITLLLMVFIHKFSNNKFIPLILALITALATPIVRGIRLDIVGIDYLLDLLWGAEWNVYFAVFPWASFILVGMFFGLWYKEKNYNDRFIFTQMFWIGVLCTAIGGGLSYYNFEYHFNDYFHLGPGGAVYLAGFNLILFCIAHLIGSYFPNNKFFDFLCYSSKRVTHLYVIQWVLVCWGMGFLGYQQHDAFGVLSILPFTLFATYAVQYLYDTLKQKIKSQKQKFTKPQSV